MKVAYEKYFEPYVVMHKSSMVRYEEMFLGRFFNKIAFFAELENKGYNFILWLSYNSWFGVCVYFHKDEHQCCLYHLSC